MPRCPSCGEEHRPAAHPVEGCESRVCPVCQRTKAQTLRAAVTHFVESHRPARRRGRASRDFYLITVGVPSPPWVSADSLRSEVAAVKRGLRALWREELRYLPAKGELIPKDRAVCKEAGMLGCVEVGPQGAVHCHALFFGAWHDADRMRQVYSRAVPGAKWLHVAHVRPGPRGLKSAVAEVCKYASKVPSAGGRRPVRCVSPTVAVLFELVMYRQKRLLSYGSMRHLGADLEEHREEHPEEHEPWECPSCGRVVESGEYAWRSVTLPRPADLRFSRSPPRESG